MSCKNLLFCLLAIIGLTAAATKKDCVSEGKKYKDGQHFQMGCQGSCTCSNGEIGCVSLCPPRAFSPELQCHSVRKIDDCCGHDECLAEMKKKKCDHTSGTGYKNVGDPWVAKITSGTGRSAKRCLGTIMDRNSIFVHEDCLGQDPITFTYPASATGSNRWAVKQKKQVPFTPHIKELVLEDTITFLPKLHEVNRPWSHFCDDKQCQMFLINGAEAVKGPKSETEYVLAKRVDKSKCNIGNNEPQIECMEIPEATRPGCTNFDGSPVLTKIGDSFYVMGFLESVSPKNNLMCDTNVNKYRKYVNTCNRIKLDRAN